MKRFKNSIFGKQIEAHRLIQWNGFLANVEKMPDEYKVSNFSKKVCCHALDKVKEKFY